MCVRSITALNKPNEKPTTDKGSLANTFKDHAAISIAASASGKSLNQRAVDVLKQAAI